MRAWEYSTYSTLDMLRYHTLLTIGVGCYFAVCLALLILAVIQ